METREAMKATRASSFRSLSRKGSAKGTHLLPVASDVKSMKDLSGFGRRFKKGNPSEDTSSVKFPEQVIPYAL